MVWDGGESILERPGFADVGREVRFRSGPRAADEARTRAMAPRGGGAAGERLRAAKHRHTGASSLPVHLEADQCNSDPASPALRRSAASHWWIWPSAAVGPRVSWSQREATSRPGARRRRAQSVLRTPRVAVAQTQGRPALCTLAERTQPDASRMALRAAGADYPLWRQILDPSGDLTIN